MNEHNPPDAGTAPGASAQRRAGDMDGKRLRNMAANMIFGLALVDEKFRVLRYNGKFRSFFEGLSENGPLLCDVLQRDCSVPDGCAGCPAMRCRAAGLNYEREFARQLPSGQEQYFRFVASSARLAPPKRQAAAGRRKTDLESIVAESASLGMDFTSTDMRPGGSAPEAPGAEASIMDESSSDTGQPTAFASRSGLTMILIEDITRKRLIEQKLLRAQRLEAMSTLTGGIAHEINQPLSALNLYASGLQILLEKDELPPLKVLRERVGLILEQSRKISEITQHMRSMAIQSGTVYEEVDVKDVLKDALQLLKERLDKENVDLQLRAPQEIPHVKAIGVQFSQVITNLVSNAADALAQMEAGHPRSIRVSVSVQGERVLIEVSDSGPGIPQGQERRIFDPFYTTKGPGGGMGLGLSIIHAFVRSWGGEVLVKARHSELGGASFGVVLRVFGMDAHPLAGSAGSANSTGPTA